MRTYKKTKKNEDITSTGPQSYRDLQFQNAIAQGNIIPTEDDLDFLKKVKRTNESIYSNYTQGFNLLPKYVQSPMMQAYEGTGHPNYWGDSMFDNESSRGIETERLSDIRAENQPWYAKISAGIGKAGVLAATTALETAGLIYGIGQGIYNEITDSNYGSDKQEGSFLNGLWNNPITNALQAINEVSEDLMPNYYTRDEQENPFSNIFTANFLGDKLLKNLGFMVGAFYGGIPLSKGIGALGVRGVEAARRASLAERAGMAKRVGELTSQYGDDIAGLNKALAMEGLTEAERGKKILEGMDKVRQAAKTTRATSQLLGSLGSAVNEGAIEAINNSKDWANQQILKANDEYHDIIKGIEDAYGGTEMEAALKVQAAEDHEKKLAEIEKGRAKMGNADLLLNLPVLMLSNMYQLGKLYTRGFDSTRRQMGSFWNGHKLSGSLEKGTLKSDKTWKGAVRTALYKSNTEGLEEYLQRAASDGAGNAVSESIDRYMRSEQTDGAKTDIDDYIAGFGKAIADNLEDPGAWEEYLIGAVSSMFGMPVFGSQTKNAYIGKNGPVGWAGGLYGNIQDYMDAKDHEEKIAEYLNQRVKDPKFQQLYTTLIKNNDLDKLINGTLEDNDKNKYKELEFEKLFNDINAAASSGHLSEFKGLIGYNTDYTDDELSDIVKETTKKVTADEQKKQDEQKKKALERQIEETQEALNEWDGTNRWKRQEIREKKLNEVQGLYQQLLEQKRQLQSQPESAEKNEALNEIDSQINEASDILNSLKDRANNNDPIWNSPKEAKARRAALSQTLEQYNEELKQINERLSGEYKDKDEGPFITMVNGQPVGMDTTEDGKQQMRDILERNKNHVLETIDNYLKIRNDIDIESDGKLKDDQISLLTQMKAKILDFDERSAEMAEDLIGSLPSISENMQSWKDKIQKEYDIVQSSYNASKQRLEEGKKAKLSSKRIAELEKAVATEEAKVNKAKQALNSTDNIIKLIDMLLEEKSTAAGEREAFSRGYGKNRLRRMLNRFVSGARNINSDEAQAILSNPHNAMALISAVLNKFSGLDIQTKDKLVQEIADLSSLANQKIAYNNQIREFLGDPSKINKAFQDSKDKISKEEIDNKAEALSLRIKNVHSMTELDNIIREGKNIDSRIVDAAMQKAKESSDENGKKFLNDYEVAAQFRDDLINLALRLPDTIKEGIIQTIQNEWEQTLADNTSASKKEVFVKGLNEAANLLLKSDDPNARQTGESLKKILTDLDAAIKATRTNTETKKTSSNNKSKKEEKELDALKKVAARKKAEQEKEARKQQEQQAAPSEETREEVMTALRKELEKAQQGKPVNIIEELSKELKERIDKFNAANPEEQITNSDLLRVFQDIIDNSIDNTQDTVSKSYTDEFENERSKEMQETVSGSFTSDSPTQYEIYLPETNEPADYKVAYEPEDAQARAVQALLQEYKAYQFVDKNYLGYVYQALDGSLPVHYLKSTREDVNNGDKGIVFLAIEYDDKVEKAIREKAFGGKNVNLQDEVKTVEIDGKRYQIVGTLSMATTASRETSKAFGELQALLSEELNPLLNEARDRGQEFVISKLTNQVNTINTGRLEKRNSEYDGGLKVNLYDFMTQKLGDANSRVSTEWENDMNFYFGVIINGELHIDDNAPEGFVEPGMKWSEKNNGAILLFVPKADGQLYPVRVTRRTVGQWLKNVADGQYVGSVLLDKTIDSVLSGHGGNEYLASIVKLLNKLLDDETSIGQKIHIKGQLSKYFVFGSNSPIHINEVDGSIEMIFTDENGDKTIEPIEGDDTKQKIQQVFNSLAAHNVLFSLPSPSTEEGKAQNGRDIITSGVFEIGLRGFYNFNANFTIFTTDSEGKPVTEKPVSSTGNHFTGNANMRGNKVTFDTGNGQKTYYIDGESNVLDEDGNDTLSNDEQNIVTMAIMAEQEQLATYIKSNTSTPQEAEGMAIAYPRYNDIFVFHSEGDVTWLYDKNEPDITKRLFRADSNRGKSIKHDYLQKLSEYRSKKASEFLGKVKRGKTIKAEHPIIKDKTEEELNLHSDDSQQPVRPNKPEPLRGNGEKSGVLVGHQIEDFGDNGIDLPSVLFRASTGKTRATVMGNPDKGRRGMFEDLQKLEAAGLVDLNSPEVLSRIEKILAIESGKERNATWDTYYSELKGC